MSTDTSERGLERLICTALTGAPCDTGTTDPQDGGSGWICGAPADYNRDYCVDLTQLTLFLRRTQPAVAAAFNLDQDGKRRRDFLARLQGEVSKRGTIDVLRRGIDHQMRHIDLFYGTPSPGNVQAAERNAANRFSVTRQLRYSNSQQQRALDIALFINGLPVATFELKNSLTKQTVVDAVEQYQRDRDPREKLFELGRCVVHFAVDDHEVRFCTHLKGKASWFLPFNQGYNHGAGNPPNPNGLKTDYLWKRVLTREGLTDILENYAQLVITQDARTRKKTTYQLWPRYHQLEVVRLLLAHAKAHGAGQRYLIQHSAGSGKSNSIAWLAHQLIRLERDGGTVFDSIIVVSDRRILDQQIRDTIKRFAQVAATVGHAQDAGDLRRLISDGKKIIITTAQKFPFILNEIGDNHRGRRFAIVIDEAHSSQGGRTSQAISTALGETVSDDDAPMDEEDRINQIIESKKMLSNASYFAFTATPKNKTLEIFGQPDPQPDGTTKYRPFHSYTMKQAIQEGFILDVLQNYTPINSYYRLIKTVADDPQYDTKRAQKKLRHYVQSHQYAIEQKAEIIVSHFCDDVLAPNKIGGNARAMVVTSGIERAIDYYHAIRSSLSNRKSPYQAIVAFSGDFNYRGTTVNEAFFNGFSSNLIAEKIQEDPYRILVCADKFQTGYDEPLLHTMYVDKPLSGIKAVQTLSRLNRAHPKKHDVFVLDFANNTDVIKESFADYYQTTILAEETDPNKLHDLKAALDNHQIYTEELIGLFVERYLGNESREKLDPILDQCVGDYQQLSEDEQVDFKSKAKAFLRMYGFLSTILPYNNVHWEKLSIFLTFLVPKLPAPTEEDWSKGILETVDMESYRMEKQATVRIQLPDCDAEIDPIPPDPGGRKAEPEIDRLSAILANFNDLFGGIDWKDKDRIHRLITEEIPQRVAADQAYQNAQQNSDPQNARIEHDKALGRVMTTLLQDDSMLVKQFWDNLDFRHWITERVFELVNSQRR